MSHPLRGFYRFGGAALAGGGMLFVVHGLLERMAGPPPSRGAEILTWAAASKGVQAWVSEVLFFATVALVPGVAALYRSLIDTERTKATLGCGAIAAVLPVLMVLLVVHGRMVYPVYGIRVSTPEVAAFAVALFYGGLHSVDLVLGGATIVLSLAMMRGPYGRAVAYLGFLAGALDLVVAYPYLIGPTATLVCRTVSAAWFVAVGAKLRRLAPVDAVSSPG